MKKEITAVIYVSINGNYLPLESIDEDQRKKIAVTLNDRAMLASGYRHKDKTA